MATLNLKTSASRNRTGRKSNRACRLDKLPFWNSTEFEPTRASRLHDTSRSKSNSRELTTSKISKSTPLSTRLMTYALVSSRTCTTETWPLFFFVEISEFCYEMDSVAKERRRQSLFDEVLPYYLERFETIVENNNGHLATGKLTWADIHFVGILDYLSFMTGKTIIAGYPGLQNLEKTILNLPGIKEWVAKRPVTRA
uniref:glutathione transferase n=1 Tax=Photinus pyralis TaxID=7054 RepID=A0A1Y1MW72_PHOPY